MDYFQLNNLFYFLFCYESNPLFGLQWNNTWLSTPPWVGRSLSSWSLVRITVAERLPQPSSLGLDKEDHGTKAKTSTKLQAFCHFPAHSAPLAVPEQKATDNLLIWTISQISAIEENLFHAAVPDHTPEMN